MEVWECLCASFVSWCGMVGGFCGRLPLSEIGLLGDRGGGRGALKGSAGISKTSVSRPGPFSRRDLPGPSLTDVVRRRQAVST